MDNLPQLDIDLATLATLLSIREERMVVLLQASLHAIEAVELDKTCAHELVGALVRTEANFSRLDFNEMLFNLLLGGGVGKVA